jgi:hypothetical protein
MAFYEEPFDAKYLLGRFQWTPAFTERFAPTAHLRHGCHDAEMRACLEADEVTLRSKCDVRLPNKSVVQFASLWCALNSFQRNQFGPFVFVIPLKRLNGRHFYLFREKERSVNRYVFFQYIEGQILFPDAPEITDPAQFFEQDNAAGGLHRTWDDFFYFALQWPVNLVGASLAAENHENCIGKKCGGMAKAIASSIIDANRSADIHSILKWPSSP